MLALTYAVLFHRHHWGKVPLITSLMPSNNEIFFSYGWGDEKEAGESREKIVNDLYESLKQDGYKVVRDKYDLDYRGFISDFMHRIGEGKNIIVAISKKYVKSPYCMFELYEIARNAGFDKYRFSERVLPVIAESIDFSQPLVLEEYLSYWQTKLNEHETLAKSRAGELSVEWYQRYNKIKVITQNFSQLAEWITDMNTLTPELLSAGNFDKIKKTIKDSVAVVEQKAASENIGPTSGGININNDGAKIGQQNVNSTVDNKGASFNIS